MPLMTLDKANEFQIKFHKHFNLIYKIRHKSINLFRQLVHRNKDIAVV